MFDLAVPFIDLIEITDVMNMDIRWVKIIYVHRLGSDTLT